MATARACFHLGHELETSARVVAMMALTRDSREGPEEDEEEDGAPFAAVPPELLPATGAEVERWALGPEPLPVAIPGAPDAFPPAAAAGIDCALLIVGCLPGSSARDEEPLRSADDESVDGWLEGLKSSVPLDADWARLSSDRLNDTLPP